MIVKIAAIVTIVVVSLIGLITYYVGASASEKKDGFQPSLYKIRSVYFTLLIVVIAGVLMVTLSSESMPYVQMKKGNPDVVVNVTGRIWAWELSSEQVPVNKVIEFALQSEDVNHGFAIYSPEGKIVAQSQVMPGYVNKLRYTFTEPGEYKILCLEYCGVAHHTMISSIKVVEEAAFTGGNQ